MAPLATWLRETRSRHNLSQESLVDAINAWARATNQRNDDGKPWKLYRPNYVGWEGGKKAQPATIARLVAYWQAQDEPAPDLSARAPEPELPSLELALRALVHELTTARDERNALRRDLDKVTATLNRVLAGTLVPAGSPAPATPRALGRTTGSAQ